MRRGVDYIGVGVGAIIVDGSPAILEPDKCSNIGWFALDAMPDDLTQVTRHDLALYRIDVARG